MEIVLYELHFDYGKTIGYFAILLLGCVIFFADKILGNRTNSLLDVKKKEISPNAFKVIVRSIGCFCFVIFLVFFGTYMFEYHEYKTMLKTDTASVVEGYVENYTPLPADGKGTENFQINGVYFAYNDADATNGYKITANNGGIIAYNGQYLKIKYVTNELGQNIILHISAFE